tara:strand:+ start:270 stop:524 length:255 start_codon:yes stop_codon:yes gene_type:complete
MRAGGASYRTVLDGIANGSLDGIFLAHAALSSEGASAATGLAIAAGRPNGHTTSSAVIGMPAFPTRSITSGCLPAGMRRADFQL